MYRHCRLGGAVTLSLLFASASSGAVAGTETITWATHPVIFEATGGGALLEEFEAQTGIKVEVQTFPSDALQQRVTAEFVSGSGALDVVNITNSFFNRDLVRFLEPLDAYLEQAPLPDGGLEDFTEGFVRQYRVPQTRDGDIYGIPNRVGLDILFYRQDLLDAAGLQVPTTWEEYVEAARVLTKDTDGDGETDIYGTVMQGNIWHGIFSWFNWSAALGGDMLTPPDWEQSALLTDANFRAAELRAQMVEEGLASPAVVNYGFDDAINAIAQGNAAMTVMFSAYWSRIENPERSTVVGRVGYAPAPRDPSVDEAYTGRGWALFIPEASEKKDAAWEFIRFITNRQSQLFMAIEHGNAATRLSVVEHPEFQASVPIAPALAKAMPHARILPNTSGIRRIYDAISTELNRSLAGEISGEEAIRRADAAVTEILNNQ